MSAFERQRGVIRRRRRSQGLERVLGTPALFSTAYGNVGSSIYYALGVTAAFALGLTPLVFVIAGVFFAATAPSRQPPRLRTDACAKIGCVAYDPGP